MRLIILIVAGFIAYRLLKNYLAPAGGEKSDSSEGAVRSAGDEEETVYDEICKSYIPRDSALRVRSGESVHYFCSEECRQTFINSRMSSPY